MVRTRTRPKRISAQLREERVSGFLPLTEGKPRVDRERGIIFGVKVVGRTSPNTHKAPGATRGTEYTLEALTRAIPLYEGLKVNIDHPSRLQPDADRQSEDRLGKLQNVRLEGGEIYADLHLLKSHPMAERLMEAAERMPDAFALSHNATGGGEVRQGTYYIDEIPRVRSVDVVADGGTNRSLFESGQPMKPFTIRQLFEAAKLKVDAKKRPNLAKFLTRLVEQDEYDVMDQEAGAGEPPADHKEALADGFRASVSAIVDNCLTGAADAKECIAKIGELLRAHGKLTEEKDEEDIEKKEEAEPPAEKKAEEKKVEESRKYCTRLAKGYLGLLENQQPAKSLVDALALLPTDDARLSLLESWPRGSASAATAPKGSAPRSTSSARPLLESSQVAPKSAEEQASLLLR